VPNFWVRMDNDPDGPIERTREIRRIVERAGGKIAGNDFYFDVGEPSIYAVIEGLDEAHMKAIAPALHVRELRELLDVAEMKRALALRHEIFGDGAPPRTVAAKRTGA